LTFIAAVKKCVVLDGWRSTGPKGEGMGAGAYAGDRKMQQAEGCCVASDL
jgi:hypothetical protein